MENESMLLIVLAGKSKSLAMESIRLAKKGEYTEAEKKLESGRLNLKEAYKKHRIILSRFSERDAVIINPLLIHSEDHLMSAVIINDLAQEFLDLYEEVHDIRKELSIVKGEIK